MKLNAIKIEDFRCFADLTLQVDTPINFIFGRNASGKSTIAEAVALALTGRCNGFNPSWRDRAALIKQGSDAFTIDLDIGLPTGNEKIHCRAEAKDCSPKPDAIARRLGVSKEVLSSLFDTAHFLSLHPDEKKRLIFDLLDLKVTRATITNRLKTWLKEQTGLINTYQIDPEEDLLPCLGAVPESLEDGYSQAFEERRLIKRELNSLGPAFEAEGGMTSELITEKIGSIQKEINTLHTRLGEAKGMVLGEKKHLEEEVRELASALKELNSPTKGLRPGPALKKLSGFEVKRSETFHYIQALNEHRKGLEKQIAALQERKAEKNAIHSRLQDFHGCCPLLQEPVPCTTEELLDAVSEIQQTSEKEMSMILNEKEGLRESMERTSGLIEEAEKERDRIDGQIAQLKEGIAQHEELKRRIDDLTERKRRAEDRLASLPAHTEETIEKSEGLKEKLTRCEKDLEKNRELLAAIEREDKRKALSAQLAKLEVLTHAFSPKGVMAGLLAKAVASLNDSLSSSMERISGGRYSLEIFINDEVDVYLINHKEGLRTNIKLASTSERFRAGIVIQYVLSNLAGLRFMLIDGLDMLDQENKGFFFRFIQEVKGEFDSIFVFSTISQYAPQHPNLPDIAFWIIEQGTVTRL